MAIRDLDKFPYYGRLKKTMNKENKSGGMEVLQNHNIKRQKTRATKLRFRHRNIVD